MISPLLPRKMTLSVSLHSKDDDLAQRTQPFAYGMAYALDISWRVPQGGWTVTESSRGFTTQGEAGEDCLPVILRFLYEDYLQQIAAEDAESE